MIYITGEKALLTSCLVECANDAESVIIYIHITKNILFTVHICFYCLIFSFTGVLSNVY